jgi:hypothetical protein
MVLLLSGGSTILSSKDPHFGTAPPSPDDDDESVLLRVQTVLSADVELHPLEVGIHEPPWNKRRAIKRVLASRLLEVDHLDLLEEIGRRERIDQEETIVEEASDIESDDKVGEEEE